MKFQSLFIIVAFCLSYNYSSYSQPPNSHNERGELLDSYKEKAEQTITNEEDNTTLDYEEAYTKLKELYLKLQESESYIKSDELIKEFNSYMNIDKKNFLELKKEGSIMEWVKKNIASTSFKNIEEAEKLNEEIKKADLEQYKENEEYYVYLLYVLTKMKAEGAKIYGDIILDYEYNNPNSITNRVLNRQY